ncbi:MAG TPA: protein kinase [Chlamydiales bacterium]|nr:protein kinase [Chlamydiales bacterium]
MKKIVSFTFFFLLLVSTSFAELPSELMHAFRAEKYQYAGQLIVASHPAISFHELQEFAEKINSKPLLRACQATKATFQMATSLGIEKPRLIQLCLFIETELPKYIAAGRTFLRNSETGLACTIEFDKATKHTFLHFEPTHSSYIGEGRFKRVTKSILYDRICPEIVANCRTSFDDKKEMKMIQSLQGCHGIVEARALITHRKKETKEEALEIILKHYNASSIREACVNKTVALTSLEKMKIAYDALRGLEELHSRKIIHRDLHSGNFLVNIEGTGRKREVRAAICDFSSSRKISRCHGRTPQLVGHYYSPEAIGANKFHVKNYFSTDIYATGCVLYRMIYGKQPEWFDQPYLKKNPRTLSPIMKRYASHQLTQSINSYTQTRHLLLLQKIRKKQASLTERFENLVLRMVNPDPKERSSAKELRQEIQMIYEAASKRMKAKG